MSILDVKNVSHGFGSRVILEDASFRLLKGEHIGLVGANGEGKTTFLNIITGNLMPDEGTVTWCNHITTGYLDQYSTLEKGKTIRDILKSAFNHMFELEQEMMGLYEKMGDCTPEEMDALMEEVGEIQSILDSGDFYSLDSKIEEYAKGLGLMDIGLERDVSELSGGQRAKILLAKVLLENPMILILDEPTNFLDENHIEWLKNFLQNYENAFILVSHDIPFLNSVVNVIYHVEITFAPPAFASSGKISGVGFAHAKMMASLFIVLTISVVTAPGAETPINTSAPTSISARDPCFF